MSKTATETQTAQSKSPHILTAINAITKSLSKEGIGKERENKDQKYKFRGIDDIYNTLAVLLAENNVVITPEYSDRIVTEKASKSGGVVWYIALTGKFTYTSALDGTFITVTTYGEAMDYSDKATNKAMSAAYKYAQLQTFCIPTEGDNDSENTTPQAVQAEPPRAGETRTVSREALATTTGAAAATEANTGAFATREERTAWLESAANHIKAVKAELDITNFQNANKKFIDSLAPNQKKAFDDLLLKRRAEIKAAFDDEVPL